MDSGSIDAWWWLTRMIMTGSARQWQGRRLNNGVQVQLISILHINSCYCTYIRIERKRNGSCLASMPTLCPGRHSKPTQWWCPVQCCRHVVLQRLFQEKPAVTCDWDWIWPCLPVPIIWTPQLLFFSFLCMGKAIMHANGAREWSTTVAICFSSSWSTHDLPEER